MSPNEKTRLGFIGLGYLGSRIARRLIGAGFPVVASDRDRTKAAEFSALAAGIMQALQARGVQFLSYHTALEEQVRALIRRRKLPESPEQ